MGAPHGPTSGSMQFYPRKRAAKILPSANWREIYPSVKEKGFLGLIAYKVAMGSAFVKDNAENSMIKGKKTVLPVTILEVPGMKIFSVRFYKNGVVSKEIIVSNDKELKRVLKLPKSLKNFDSEAPKEFEDIRVIAYSLPKYTSIKKTPDLIEMGISSPDKLEFVKSMIGKEFSFSEMAKTSVIDIRALTKGHGLSGPVKRFGIKLRSHKSEKGRRGAGSIGPWHPARVMFMTPLAGQLGMFSRVHYNHNIIHFNSIKQKDINPNHGFKHYGKILTNYILIKGSVQGPQKRAVFLTSPMRLSKSASKKKYEFQELITK